ncbi:heme-dependent oxidative N-demethylase family protein [Thalassobaculum litoreum]|uniref:DUF3445 domain-containing protein n=1 Tax=Thalassobaculum litoreum DSM 18839 TaxID=1123362 RepID=A0A8G2BGZ1_9PROT|nr:DUF3445 domain-containing protein [Thalassobaculum litoreum]SDF64545.1 Protein of unknown function [Thalassobaculum litoreum DSM 18839]
MTATPAPHLRFAPYEKGRFQLTLGIKEIAAADWIDVDAQYAEHMAEKRRLLDARHGEVFAGLHDSLPAQRDCLEAVLAHMTAFHPDLIAADGSGVHTAWDGATLNPSDFESAPLDLAGRLVQEDLCLMQPSDEGHKLIAASLCFPARWRLADKIGRPMSAIHDPVPGFNDRLNRPVERFFAGIAAGQTYMRLNWSVLDDPALFQPTGHGRRDLDPTITPRNITERLHIRIERQTFRRLPRTGVLVFGIKTLIDPIAAIAGRPDLAAAMLGSLRTMPADMRGYKSMAPFADALEGWLQERAEASAG